ncbi:serine/threonine-protein kinase [Nonomuraea salmonea]|uniref:serine/threonine-protein kinase n=1 Tax=Nonomuraea salmonea TaxID=46181 RepID=UPI002FEC3841
MTDFGIARALEAAPVTQTGTVLGTAQYVSPEQAQGFPLTPSTDLYSLGVVAYECLAGRTPFRADSQVAIALLHLNEQPPPLGADVPAAVRELVMGLLAKEPAQRPGSAIEVADRAYVLRESLAGGGARRRRAQHADRPGGLPRPRAGPRGRAGHRQPRPGHAPGGPAEEAAQGRADARAGGRGGLRGGGGADGHHVRRSAAAAGDSRGGRTDTIAYREGHADPAEAPPVEDEEHAATAGCYGEDTEADTLTVGYGKHVGYSHQEADADETAPPTTTRTPTPPHPDPNAHHDTDDTDTHRHAGSG